MFRRHHVIFRCRCKGFQINHPCGWPARERCLLVRLIRTQRARISPFAIDEQRQVHVTVFLFVRFRTLRQYQCLRFDSSMTSPEDAADIEAAMRR